MTGKEPCKGLADIMEDMQLGKTSKEEGAKLVKSHIENHHSEEGFCWLCHTQTSYGRASVDAEKLSKLADQRAETRFFALLAEKGITLDAARRRGYYAMFRDGYARWKEEGKDSSEIFGDFIPRLISDIQGLEEARAVIRQRARPLPGEAVRARIGRSGFPVRPSNPLEWPRRPSSREKTELWNNFRYRLQEQGFNAFEYSREFGDYIENTTFRDWNHLREKFDYFTEAIMKGDETPLPPPVVWHKDEAIIELDALFGNGPDRLDKMIVHYTTLVIRNERSRPDGKEPKLGMLMKELEESELLEQGTKIDRETVKNIIDKAWDKARSKSEKDYAPYFAGISRQELDRFLSTAEERPGEGE